MFYGVRITYGVSSWQVFARKNGQALVTLGGSYRREQGSIKAGIRSATPVVRLVRESDNSLVYNWVAAHTVTDDTWEAEIVIPAGGLYRVETCLDTVSEKTGEHWMFRGDIRTHIGCGDVFVIAGQSNAAGYGKGVAFDAPDMRVHVKRNSGVWDMATHPLNDSTDAYDCPNAPMSILGTSPFLSFGKRHADYTGCPVGLLPTAQGGTSIKLWDPRGGILFKNMISKIQRLDNVTGILWYQGCTDAMNGEAEGYFDSFLRLVNATRRILKWDIPFYTFQINAYLADKNNADWGIVKEAQRRAAREIPGVYLLPTTGFDLADDIHNSALSNVRLGEQLADLVNRDVKAPDLESAHIENGNIVLKFSNVAGKLYKRDQTAYGSGFKIEDEAGEVPACDIRTLEDTIILKPSRPLGGSAFISYEYEATPAPFPIMDDVTYLSVIPFYKVKII